MAHVGSGSELALHAEPTVAEIAALIARFAARTKEALLIWLQVAWSDVWCDADVIHVAREELGLCCVAAQTAMSVIVAVGSTAHGSSIRAKVFALAATLRASNV